MKDEHWNRLNSIEQDPFGIEYLFTLAVCIDLSLSHYFAFLFEYYVNRVPFLSFEFF